MFLRSLLGDKDLTEDEIAQRIAEAFSRQPGKKDPPGGGLGAGGGNFSNLFSGPPSTLPVNDLPTTLAQIPGKGRLASFLSGNVGKRLTGLAGSILASELNKPSKADRDAQAALARAANAQASDVERNTALKNFLEAKVKGLKPLSGQAKNDLIQLRPGKKTDFSGVQGTGDIALLMQLAGLGAPSGAIGQAGLLANQNASFGAEQTKDTVDNLVELLLGLGQNN